MLLEFIRWLANGKDGYVPGWAIGPRNRAKLKRLVTMEGITTDEHRELWRLAQKPSDENLRKLQTLTAEYEARGARFTDV